MNNVRIWEADVQSANGRVRSFFGLSLHEALDFADPDFISLRLQSYVVGSMHIDDIRATIEGSNEEVL